LINVVILDNVYISLIDIFYKVDSFRKSAKLLHYLI